MISLSSVRKSALAAMLLLALSSTQTGCKWLARRAAEKAIKESSGAKNVDFDRNGNVDMEDGKGNKFNAGTSVKLPDGWPSYAPAYPGATITLSVLNPTKSQFSAIMTSSDSADQIMSFYKSKFTSNGFKSEAVANFGGTRTETYKNHDGRTLTVVVADADGKRSITLTGSEKP